MANHPNQSLQLAPAADGSLTVWIDSPGRSVNVFDAGMLNALESAIDHIAATNRYRVVLFRSRKPGCFFAGADVTTIAGLDHKDAVRAIVARGQDLMQRLFELEATTVAVIDGMCLGGGLEFAMACTHRVASDSSHTKMSLPEIRLGLIPGWGGTQRLPHLVGIQRALQMILKGSSLTARKAQQAGLVDRLLNGHDLDAQLGQLVGELSDGSWNAPRRRVGWTSRLLENNAIGRRLVLHMARKQVAAQTANYPALLEAIEAVRRAFNAKGLGYEFEREAFTRLLFTPTAQSLLSLFVARDRAKKRSTWLPVEQSTVERSTVEPTTDRGLTDGAITEKETTARTDKSLACQRIAIIGAGAMGAGIGALAAQRGLEVVFKEIDERAARGGAERVRELIAEQVAARRLSASEGQAANELCATTTRWDDLSECDLAIEAVLEIDSVKRDVFEQLDRWLPAHASLVSNTSSLNITQMAAATRRRSHVAGLHFFNPVERMELVEVVRTEMTSEATVTQLLNLVKRLGKTPIVTSDKPGFLVNRVLFPYMGEAVRMVAEGYDIVTIDRELRQFGMPMGPLELIDQVGIDIASHVAGSLAKIQLDAEVPAAFLRDMADRKWLGKKTQLGFYRWGKKRLANTAIKRQPLMPTEQFDFKTDGLSMIQRRLVYPMLNEAVHCLDELVVTEPWMVDLGMVLGTGFAPHHGGPLRLIDRIGTRVVLSNMLLLERWLGRRFAPADGLAIRAARQEAFFSTDKVPNPLAWESNHESRCSTES